MHDNGAMEKATRVLLVLLGVAFVVSVVHYTDNYVNYDDYPQPGDDGLPAPSKTVVGRPGSSSRRPGSSGCGCGPRPDHRGCLALTGYSVSGLIGFGHYTVEGATDMVWWRQTHVVVDIVCGIAILGFALWAALRATPRAA